MSLLGREEILHLLGALSEELRRRGTRAEIFLVGGAAMALAYDGRALADVDDATWLRARARALSMALGCLSYYREREPALAAQAVAVAALFSLNYQRSLNLQWRAAVEVLSGRGQGTPGLHLR